MPQLATRLREFDINAGAIGPDPPIKAVQRAAAAARTPRRLTGAPIHPPDRGFLLPQELDPP
jgi:hypothetical protein